jgi:hypothetical protein
MQDQKHVRQPDTTQPNIGAQFNACLRSYLDVCSITVLERTVPSAVKKTSLNASPAEVYARPVTAFRVCGLQQRSAPRYYDYLYSMSVMRVV